MWITSLIHKGARLLKVALIRVSANKQKFSRFRFSKAIWELWFRQYCKQTHNDRKSWKDLMFLSHIYIPKVPNIPKNVPVGQRERWLWLLSRKWERYYWYTRMLCGNKRGDFFIPTLVNINNLSSLKNAARNLRFICYKAISNNGLYCFLQVFQSNILA